MNEDGAREGDVEAAHGTVPHSPVGQLTDVNPEACFLANGENQPLLFEQEREQRKLRQELAEVRAALEAVTQERELLGAQLEALRGKHAETEQMAREVHKLYEISRGTERRARNDAAIALEKSARMRQHLSYRLGAALIESSRGPLAWVKAPITLRRAYLDFVRNRADRTAVERARPTESLRLGGPALGFSMLLHWQEIHITADGSGQVWAHALSVTSGSTAGLDMQIVSTDEAARVDDAAGEPASPDSSSRRSLKLRAGRSALLFRYVAHGTLTIRLRKTRGEPCILKLEVRADHAGMRGGTVVPGVRGAGVADVSRPAARKKVKALRAAPVTNVLFESFKLVRDGRGEEGLQLALTHAGPAERQGVSLIRALLVESDEAAWLGHLNDYLRPMGIAPLSLSSTGPSRFHRLQAATVRQIEDGPLVSVIMPAYNAESTLDFAASSILAQTWRRLQLIIVDDASSDQTWTIAQAIAARDPRVRALRNAANVGPYVSKNIALKIATGDYVTGHDADDWAHPERVELHLAAMTAAKKRASLTGMLRMTASGELTRFAPRGPNTSDGALVAGFISCLFETHFLKQVLGGWDEVRFAGDSEIIQRTEKLLGSAVPRFPQLGMICLDSPEGLTNHPELGYSPLLGMSLPRREYRDSFKRWHDGLTPGNGHLHFPQTKRVFDAPATLEVDSASLAETIRQHTHDGVLRGEDRCDVCIVTDLRLAGGNASSTLDEVRYFMGRGLKVLLVHCPTPRTQGKPTSERYAGYADICVPFHDVTAVHANVVIVRHPAVAASAKFRELAARIQASAAAVIINNSIERSDATRVYAIDDLLANVALLGCEEAHIFPLGPAIRRELTALRGAEERWLAPRDWTPTFDSTLLAFRPKSTMEAPFVIGRHARDGAEKWIEHRDRLQAAYPDASDFSVVILGGADAAFAILGERPTNWEVLPFGSVEPAEYLSKLDALVYFPNSGLNEAFGRAIMEAIFAGVPCILPKTFRTTFEDMAFYTEPEDVAGVVRRLSRHAEWRLDFLRHARERARQYESNVLLQRLAGLGMQVPANDAAPQQSFSPLSAAVREYKAWVETGRWSMQPAITGGN